MVDAFASAAAPDVQATFCATLVDQWLRLGVRHAVVAPGSRSTPMALALAARSEMQVHVIHDERVAGFTALGLGLPVAAGEPGIPALLLCTSGTAAANFLPAVVEAGLSEVPMVVLTADRPEELRGVGAPQTIDQLELYGRHVRWFHDADVASPDGAPEWRSLATTAWRRATTGPVQLNLAFREPLLGTALRLPGEIDVDATVDEIVVGDPVPAGFDQQRGVILVGGGHRVARQAISALSERTQWPVIADPLSGMRDTATVTTIDALLRHDRFAADHAPDVVVRIGRPSTSKLLAQWTARPELTVIQVGGPGRIDPAHNVSAVCSIDDLLAAETVGASGTTWMARWQHAEATASSALDSLLGSNGELDEPTVARLLAVHSGLGTVTVSSSMPVRDFEWFGGRTASAHANRGANGIDGVMSTALGRALARGSAGANFVLIGDLAFVHDVNALVGLVTRGVDLRIVVVDNDGGGIFSFLPQATALPPERFEQLFGTPLGVDVIGLARAHGLTAVTVTTAAALVDQLAVPGPWVCRVPTDRAENVRVHSRLHAAVSSALG